MDNKSLQAVPNVAGSCQHTKVYWGELKVSYDTDGTCISWQDGSCSTCGQLFVQPYGKLPRKAA